MPSSEIRSPGRLKRWLSTVAAAGVVIAAGSYAGSHYFNMSPAPQAARAAGRLDAAERLADLVIKTAGL